MGKVTLWDKLNKVDEEADKISNFSSILRRDVKEFFRKYDVKEELIPKINDVSKEIGIETVKREIIRQYFGNELIRNTILGRESLLTAYTRTYTSERIDFPRKEKKRLIKLFSELIPKWFNISYGGRAAEKLDKDIVRFDYDKEVDKAPF